MTGSALVVQGNALRLPLADESVDLIVTSPPYFALRSYRDGDEHYDGQIGSEPTPADFLRALWAVMDECWRVLKPTGVAAINLGDKYAGSGGHNNANVSRWRTAPLEGGKDALALRDENVAQFNASRRNAPDRYNQATDVRAKSVMGLPWRFALGLSIPDPYRTCYDPGEHPQWINRRPLVWDKPNGLPESVTDRPRASSEDWFILTKQGRYFAAIDEIREQYNEASIGRYDYRFGVGEAQEAAATPSVGDGTPHFKGPNPLGKLPGSVWSIEGDNNLWDLFLNGPMLFCPRCGRDLRAGNGLDEKILKATASSGSVMSASDGPTDSSMNTSSDPSRSDSPSTISAETPDASTPSIWNQSRQVSTDGEQEPISAGTGMSAPRATRISEETDAGNVECVCATINAPDGPGSVWSIPSEPLIVPEWAKEKYNLPDFFAAFPTEWPRRLILAFSPNGICTACNEGRRPVVDKTYSQTESQGRYNPTKRTSQEGMTSNGGWNRLFAEGQKTLEATITGYACACTPYTDHRGKGGSGRSYGEAVDLGKPYERDEKGWDARQALDRRPKVGSRREYHFDRWTPPETRPAVVLDPFGGTGTTAMVARALGRIGISVDLSHSYGKLARWRIEESRHGQKALSRTWSERQGSML